jgi:hypothetical protein
VCSTPLGKELGVCFDAKKLMLRLYFDARSKELGVYLTPLGKKLGVCFDATE